MLRRSFLKGLGAAALAEAALPSRKARGEDKDINTILQEIRQELCVSPHVGTVSTHLVDHPDVGLVQWEWVHFDEWTEQKEIPLLEEVNKEIFLSMQAVRQMPDAGLDQLMHESFVKGGVQQTILEYVRIHRSLVAEQFKTRILFGPRNLPASKETVDREMKVEKNIHVPVRQIIIPHYRSAYYLTLSPLARLGPGYMLSRYNNMQLRASEDPAIFEEMLKAMYTEDREDDQKWIFDERNKYFASLARSYRGRIGHVLLGYEHDLRKDIEEGHCNGDKHVSHLVVRPKSLAAYFEANP
jgi:hypothetical protein